MLRQLRSITVYAFLAAVAMPAAAQESAPAAPDSAPDVMTGSGHRMTVRSTDQGIVIDGDATTISAGALSELLRTALQSAGALAPTAQGPVRVFDQDVEIGRGEIVEAHILVTDGDIDVAGRIEGSVITLQGDVQIQDGGHVSGDVLAPHGRIQRRGIIEGRAIARGREASARSAGEALQATGSGLVSVIGIVLALCALGFGAAHLTPAALETGSETVNGAFGRSMAAGLLGQALLVPTLVTLVVGLALTVVGIIVVPFAVAAFAVLVILAGAVGVFAVLRALGERIVERQPLGIDLRADSAFTQLVAGLVPFAVIWALAVLLHWAPVAGTVLLVAAIAMTWLAFTAGFGAALLSRLGTRDSFTGRISAQLTDEYLWPTPIATPAARRPKHPR